MAAAFENPYVSALQSFYNKLGSQYDAMTQSFHSEGARCIVEAAGPAISQGSYVLDLACGTGNVALIAAGKTGSEGGVLGIDISDTFLEQATEKAKKLGLGTIASFSHQDATNLKLPVEFAGKKFDAITCGSAIVMFPDVKAVLQIAAKQILKPGGVFVADVNDGNIAARVFLEATIPKGFQAPFDARWLIDAEQSLRDIFEGSAFEVKDVIVHDNPAGTKDWDVNTPEKLNSIWTSLAEQQAWVSYGLDQLSREQLEEARQDWIRRMSALKNNEGVIVGKMKQFIVVAQLK